MKEAISKSTRVFVILLLCAAAAPPAPSQTAGEIADELAEKGAAIAKQDPVVAAARTAEPDIFYWEGFDIATAIFGDPSLGAQGNTAIGPGSQKIRDSLSAAEQRGFDAGVRFHLSRDYKRTPGEVTRIDSSSKRNAGTWKAGPDPPSNEIRCRGFAGFGVFTTENSKLSSTGETIVTMLLTSQSQPVCRGAERRRFAPRRVLVG